MDRVVSAQPELLGKLSSLVGERPIDPDQQQLALQRVKLLARPTVSRGAQAPAPSCRAQRRTALGVAQDARRRAKRRAPQLGHEFRAVLDDQELDERRDRKSTRLNSSHANISYA